MHQTLFELGSAGDIVTVDQISSFGFIFYYDLTIAYGTVMRNFDGLLGIISEIDDWSYDVGYDFT